MELEIQDQDILKILNYLDIKNKKVRAWIAGIETFFLRVDQHHLYLISAGIAFNILLYLIPLLLIAIYLVNIIFGVASITSFLTDTLGKILPPNKTTTEFLSTTLNEIIVILNKSSLAGIIGILTLLWLSSTLLSSLRTGLNTIFHISTPKIFFIYKLKDIFQIIALCLLVLLASFVFPLLTVTAHYIQSFVPPSVKFISSWLYLSMISMISSFLLFYFIFTFVPNKRMPRFIRLISTLLCIVLVEISRYIFAWYIGGVTSYGKFYGTYGILASIAVWVFYFTMIILFSAEFSQLIYDIKYKD